MKYKCIPCNHEFEAPENTKPRCPRCLKIHDVEPLTQNTAASGPAKKKNIVPVILLLAAAAIAATYYFTKKNDNVEKTAEVKDAGSIFTALNIPEDEAVDPCAVTPEIEAFAENAADGKDGVDGLYNIYQSILKMKESSRWRPYSQREPREGRPLTATKLLAAFKDSKEQQVQALSYELSCLLYASAKAAHIDSAMAEVLSFNNEKTPADPEGKFGRFGVVAASGEGAAKAPLFDLWGGRAKEAAAAKVNVLSARAAMAPYFGIAALSFLVRQDMSKALALNEIATKLDPNNPYFRSGRGFIFAATGVASEALVEFEKALKSRSDAVQRINLAEILLLVSPMDKRAENEVQSALSEMPDFARAHAVMGVIHLMRGEKDQAETELGIAERLDPKSPAIAMYWARFYAATMQSEEAVAKAKQAVTLSDRSLSSLLGLAGVYREVAEFSEMRAILDEVYSKMSTPETAEQIKGIFGYDPAPETAVSSAGEASDKDTDKATTPSSASDFELKLGGGLGGKAPSLGGGGLTLDGAEPDGLGAKKGPGLGDNLKLDMNLKQ